MSDSESDGPSRPSGGILPGFIGRSFLAKFLISLLVVTVLVGGVSALTYQQTSESVNEDISTEYIGLAQQSATQIQEWQDSRVQTARMFSQFEAVQTDNQNRTQRFLEAEASRLPEDIYRVHLVNLSTATIIASTSAAKEGETLNTREAPWQNDDLDYGENEVFISNASEVHLRSIVSFVSPVPGSDRVIVMQTNLDEVANDLPTPSDTTRVFSQVVDAQGRVVAGTQETSDIARNDGTLEAYSGDEDDRLHVAVRRGLRGESGFLQPDRVKNIEGAGPHVAAFAPLPANDLVVITHVPAGYAYALRDTITRNLAILAATTLLGLGTIGLVFGRRTVGALNRLAGKARELESGNLDVDLEVTRRDEFGSLTASFASMRNALREQINEAEQARKEAEVSRAEAMEVNNYLQEKAQEYSEVMQACARGDLTRRLEPGGQNDAMDQIAENFNEMLSELEMTTGQLKTFAAEVGESGQAVQESAETVRDASEQVASAIQEVSADATDQRERLENLSADIQASVEQLDSLAENNPDLEFGESLEQIQAVADSIEAAVEQSDEMTAESETVAAAAQEQAAELSEVSGRAGELTQYAQYLGDGLKNFETDQEHEFVFQTGAGSTGSEAGPGDSSTAPDGGTN